MPSVNVEISNLKFDTIGMFAWQHCSNSTSEILASSTRTDSLVTNSSGQYIDSDPRINSII